MSHDAARPDGAPERDPEVLAAIDAAVDAQRAEREAFLAELVRVPSELGREHDAQHRMADAFGEAGLEVDAWPLRYDDLRDLDGFSPVDWPEDGRTTVVGAHRAAAPRGRSLILNGHVDVVPAGPADAWSAPPYGAEVRGGWMIGRGAGDMKAGLATNLFVVKALAAAGFAPAADLILQSVVEEECTGNGALATVQRGYRADAAVIPEPFDHTLLTAQLGVLWARVTVRGRPTHVLEATAGADAIRMAWTLIEALRELEAEMNDPAVRPPAYADAVHPVNLNVGRIHGGEWTSSVPAECTFEARIGFFPGTSVADAKRALASRIEAAAAAHPVLREMPPRIDWVGFHAEPYEIGRDEAHLPALARAHADVLGGEPATLASTATTDARILGRVGGVPTTCYGPRARSIHGVDEAVDLDSAHDVTRVLARFVAAWCGLRPVSGP